MKDSFVLMFAGIKVGHRKLSNRKAMVQLLTKPTLWEYFSSIAPELYNLYYGNKNYARMCLVPNPYLLKSAS